MVITETGPGTTVREGGLGSGPVPDVDSYAIRLAADPGLGKTVYVTISAARSPQEEADDTFSNPEPIIDPVTHCRSATPSTTATPTRSGSAPAPRSRARRQTTSSASRSVNGVLVDENNRALVFTFTGGAGGTWKTDQQVFVYAVDDPRSEGDRVVVVQHSTISDNPKFDQIQVRNVEVMVRDNDTPGIYVIQVAPGTSDEDQRSIVIEGGCFNPATPTVKPVDNVDQPDLHRPAAQGLHRPHGRDPDPAAEGSGHARRSASSSFSTQRASRRSSSNSSDPLGRCKKWVFHSMTDPLEELHLLHDRLRHYELVDPGARRDQRPPGRRLGGSAERGHQLLPRRLGRTFRRHPVRSR